MFNLLVSNISQNLNAKLGICENCDQFSELDNSKTPTFLPTLLELAGQLDLSKVVPQSVADNKGLLNITALKGLNHNLANGGKVLPAFLVTDNQDVLQNAEQHKAMLNNGSAAEQLQSDLKFSLTLTDGKQQIQQLNQAAQLLSHSAESQFSNNENHINNQTFNAFLKTDQSTTFKLPTIQLNMSDAGWNQAFTNRILWLVNNQYQRASLQLNPPELGPLKIDLAYTPEQVTINFVTHGIQAKEAIDFALPKLHAMLHTAGLSTVNVDVTDSGIGSHSNQADQREVYASNFLSRTSGIHPTEQIDSQNLAPHDSNLALLDIYV